MTHTLYSSAVRLSYERCNTLKTKLSFPIMHILPSGGVGVGCNFEVIKSFSRYLSLLVTLSSNF